MTPGKMTVAQLREALAAKGMDTSGLKAALVARKVRVAAVLPNGHEILTVTEAKWHRVPLRDPTFCVT